MSKITFITSHPQKAEQLGWHLDYQIDHKKLDLPEIQSLDLEEVVSHKAYEAFRQVGSPVLVEDMSLRFLALEGLPGPLFKWFLQELRVEGLCKLLDGYKDRTAVAEVSFALYDGKDLNLFGGSLDGKIASLPRGEAVFEMDSIFIPNGSQKTWAEMNKEEQIETSVRRIALKKLGDFLKK
ncbi:MAG: hypothetical protein A3F94_00140 [Candidatus Spechtbacteria bacterium RIFCSPLOWO2_12_FULL_38_22]|uniref:Non-canonical purine NTP pyrophosphatase n=1 Tax=Candidatus Spechtbacteria bacterium RIFCSPLOWO2_12_FULL_38_22 TaxID=1802165 RepID=A0A1G2HH83_9BACT|nr:MAG: hypothetical protein A2728_03315 [Candidatus Spechtbacteria bacterium RIFCSPHIGHO2_01_FULL_38_11]OGZ59211.1 MAG: hypothetical protein A3E58_00140 [Candidatus Spechtbacteria bacterium RIFCSPHIGHO2_12_FULL_38_30]OGZ59990.1 MAG: hypothetical protein A3A00_01320 [Candidatus Spechtbacteria bacterium RIFCSPLOWO2_01_FULL_38_20]OGZ61630.1 MAG: hypothetical protein A3F94_00140 [Candidatus Spechtbacteria bacterium RIFCSPLOWO2_12_FULL_38_22]